MCPHKKKKKKGKPGPSVPPSSTTAGGRPLSRVAHTWELGPEAPMPDFSEWAVLGCLAFHLNTDIVDLTYSGGPDSAHLPAISFP